MGPGGVSDFGMFAMDGPVTWEVLALPRANPASWGAGDQSPFGAALWRELGGAASRALSGVASAPGHLEVGRRRGEPEPRRMKARKSEDPIGALTSGKCGSDPAEQRGPVLIGTSGGKYGRCEDCGIHITSTNEGS